MVDYLIIIGLITIAIVVIIELVNYKIVPHFNIINMVFHLCVASSIMMGITDTII